MTPIQRLVKAGYTVQVGPSPMTDSLRIRVYQVGGGWYGISRYLAWSQLDDAKLDLLKLEFEDIEQSLNLLMGLRGAGQQTSAEPAAQVQTGTPRTVPPLPDAGSEPRPGH